VTAFHDKDAVVLVMPVEVNVGAGGPEAAADVVTDTVLLAGDRFPAASKAFTV
jgi:hypothetical protein